MRKKNIIEWIGTTDDSAIPDRVWKRIKANANGVCQECGLLGAPGSDVDHIKAICNGGQNRESNLQFLCKTCHKLKTGEDMHQKAADARTQVHLGRPKQPNKQWPPKQAHKPKRLFKKVVWIDELGRDRVTNLPSDGE